MKLQLKGKGEGEGEWESECQLQLELPFLHGHREKEKEYEVARNEIFVMDGERKLHTHTDTRIQSEKENKFVPFLMFYYVLDESALQLRRLNEKDTKVEKGQIEK